MRPFVPAPVVADLLGLPSGAAFLARRDMMETNLLFPRPMPHSRRPLLWKSAEVQAWIDRNGGGAQPEIDPGLIASGKVALLAMASTA